MTTTNATMQSVPGFWEKWWNAFLKLFKRNQADPRLSEKLSTAKVDQPRPAEGKAAA